MKFPRTPENKLDYNAFTALTQEDQVAAFNDLKANGTVEERQDFQDLIKKIKAMKQIKKEMENLDQEIQKTDKEILATVNKMVTSQIKVPAKREDNPKDHRSSSRGACLIS